MGDTGDDFKFMQEHKREERAKKEPKRFDYALGKLSTKNLTSKIDRLTVGADCISIILANGGQIDFWPYTGWFCGRKPLGKIKGRGIANLTAAIKGLT